MIKKDQNSVSHSVQRPSLNGSSQRTTFEKFTRTKAKKNSESIDTKRFWKNKNKNKIQKHQLSSVETKHTSFVTTKSFHK